MHLRLQSRPGDRGEHPLAALWAIRGRAERQGDQGPPNKQVQGIRICHHDKLRRGAGGYSVPERLHTGQQSAAGLLQDKQPEGLN